VGEIPDDPRVVLFRARREAGQIGDLSGAIVDKGPHDDRAVTDWEFGVVEVMTYLPARLLGDAFHDVAVGGELTRLNADEMSVGCEIDGGANQLVEVDARRVVDDHLTGAGTDDRGELVTDVERKVEPVLPRGDETFRPFCGHHLVDAVNRATGGHAEGVSVEVGEVGVVDDELVAPPGEWILRIEFDRLSAEVVESTHWASFGTREESTPSLSSRSISSAL
jgi:hypothetical protein